MINKNCKIPQSKQEFLSQMVEGTPKLQSFVACFVVFELYVGVLCELRKWRDRAERIREIFFSFFLSFLFFVGSLSREKERVRAYLQNFLLLMSIEPAERGREWESFSLAFFCFFFSFSFSPLFFFSWICCLFFSFFGQKNGDGHHESSWRLMMTSFFFNTKTNFFCFFCFYFSFPKTNLQI